VEKYVGPTSLYASRCRCPDRLEPSTETPVPNYCAQERHGGTGHSGDARNAPRSSSTRSEQLARLLGASRSVPGDRNRITFSASIQIDAAHVNRLFVKTPPTRGSAIESRICAVASEVRKAPPTVRRWLPLWPFSADTRSGACCEAPENSPNSTPVPIARTPGEHHHRRVDLQRHVSAAQSGASLPSGHRPLRDDDAADAAEGGEQHDSAEQLSDQLSAAAPIDRRTAISANRARRAPAAVGDVGARESRTTR